MLLTNWTVALSNTCLALAIAAVVSAQPEGGLLLVPPTVLLMAAYRAYLSERRRNAELEFLYEATRTLSRSSEIVPELEALLARTASAFRVDAVDLVLFSAEPNRSARSSLDRDGSRRMLEPIDEPLAESLRALAAGLTGPVEIAAHPRHRPARLLPLARHGEGRGRAAPRRVRLRRAVLHRRTRERRPQLLRRGPAPARDADRQRDRRAPVRPPGAGGAPARVAPARARAQGALRLAHPAGEPLALPQPPRARAAQPAARASACCCSTSTSSRPSTTATATTPATSCCAPSRTACATACARATPRRAWAATSSRCCSTAAAARSTPSRSRSGC